MHTHEAKQESRWSTQSSRYPQAGFEEGAGPRGHPLCKLVELQPSMQTPFSTRCASTNATGSWSSLWLVRSTCLGQHVLILSLHRRSSNNSILALSFINTTLNAASPLHTPCQAQNVAYCKKGTARSMSAQPGALSAAALSVNTVLSWL